LTTSRLRFLGGATDHWGGWCLPLDAIDFEGGDDLPHHEWPFPKSSLDPWYRQAQEVCDLGPYDYRPASWGIGPNKIPPPFSGPNFESKILQVSPVHFGPVYAADLRRAPRVTVYLYANAFNLDGGEGDAEITQLSAKTFPETIFRFALGFIYWPQAGSKTPGCCWPAAPTGAAVSATRTISSDASL
jgi:choline dehydrogenase-like flavoprotein